MTGKLGASAEGIIAQAQRLPEGHSARKLIERHYGSAHPGLATGCPDPGCAALMTAIEAGSLAAGKDTQAGEADGRKVHDQAPPGGEPAP